MLVCCIVAEMKGVGIKKKGIRRRREEGEEKKERLNVNKRGGFMRLSLIAS